MFLRVLGRRDDGFHDLESVVLPLSLHDLVTVSPDGRVGSVGDGRRRPRAHRDEVPTGEDNLVTAAVRELSKRAGDPAAASEVVIDKRIPVAAGLGGGSADAAATLVAWPIISPSVDGFHGDRPTSTSIAAELGSDVPAMLAGGPVMVSGPGRSAHPRPHGDHLVGAEAVRRRRDGRRRLRVVGSTLPRPVPTPAC